MTSLSLLRRRRRPWKLLPLIDKPPGFMVETIAHDGRVTTSVPPSWCRDLTSAVGWLQSQIESYAEAEPGWSSYETKEVRLTWTPEPR